MPNCFWNESGSQTAEIPKPLGFWDPETPRLLVQNVPKPYKRKEYSESIHFTNLLIPK